MGNRENLPTIWEVPDDLWARIQPVLQALDPPKATGRPRVDPRQQLNGIIFRLRTGCQWNQLPREFGDDSTVHRTFQRWAHGGVFELLWGLLVEECTDLGGVSWEWQAADAALGKARSGGTRLGRTQRTEENQAANAASWWSRTAGR